MAGKKIQGATINVKVTDGDSLKDIERKAKKAGKGLDETGKSAGDVRRNMQAMSGRVESGSKAFARMQQGTGGLVQSYAILASTLFALGAAFRVMQNAADFKALQQSQVAFAASTGVNMKAIAEQLKAATSAQIDLQQAGAASAIMIAKGFTTEQITQVAEASKNAAIALGRNFEDTFNRIVQGTTKAEPELLDELGITLRLEIAARKYGAQIGKNFRDLTTYEKSQAVLNETLRQASENFDAIAGRVPVNQLNQLQTTFSDLIQSILGFFSPIANFFADILNKNIVAAIAVVGLFAKSIIGQIFPSIGGIGAMFTQAANEANIASERMKGNLDSLRQRAEVLRASGTEGGFAAAGASEMQGQAKQALKQSKSKSPVLKRAMKGKMTGTDQANLSKALRSAEQQYQRHGVIKTGIFKNTDIKIVRNMEVSFAKMKAGSATTSQKMGLAFQTFGARMQIIKTKIQAGFSTMFATLSAGAARASAFMSKVMGAAGVIGVIIMVIAGLRQLFKNFDRIINAFKNFGQQLKKMAAGVVEFFGFAEKAEEMRKEADDAIARNNRLQAEREAAKRLEEKRIETIKELTDRTREFRKELQEVEDKFKGTTRGTEIMANQIATSGLLTNLRALEDPLNKGVDELKNLSINTEFVIERLNKLNPLFKSLNVTINTSAEDFEVMVAQMQSLGRVSKELKEVTEGLIQSRASLIKQVEGTFFEKELKALKEAVRQMDRFTKTTGDSTELFDDIRDSIKSITGEEAETVLNARILLNNRLQQFQTLVEIQDLVAKITAADKIDSIILGIVNTKVNKRLKDENKLTTLAAKRVQVAREQEIQLKTLTFTYGEQSREVQKLKSQHEDNLGLIDAQIAALQTQLSLMGQIAVKFTETFEKSTQSNLVSRFLGEKEGHEAAKAIRDALEKELMNIAVERFIVTPLTAGLQASFGLLRETVTKVFDPLGLSEGVEIKQMSDQEKVLKNHVTSLADVLGQHVRNVSLAVQGKETEEITADTVTDKHGLTEGTLLSEADNQLKLLEEQAALNLKIFTDSIAHKGAAFDLNDPKDQHLMDMYNQAYLDEQTVKGFRGQVQGGDVGLASSVFEALEGKTISGATTTGLIGDISKIQLENGRLPVSLDQTSMAALTQGEAQTAVTEGVDKAFGGSTGVDGAAGVTGGPLGSIMNMFGMGSGGGSLGGSGILSTILGFIPGLNMIAPFLKMFGLERGGIIGLAKGGVMPRYAAGGIATQPTYLVGEGKKHEAVVPLPDNRSIPVNMKGGGGTNNTNISVNIDQNGNATADVTADGAAALGEAINLSVMETLVREQRPGGLLNATG